MWQLNITPSGRNTTSTPCRIWCLSTAPARIRTIAHVKTLLKVSFMQPVTDVWHTKHEDDTDTYNINEPCWYLNASPATLTRKWLALLGMMDRNGYVSSRLLNFEYWQTYLTSRSNQLSDSITLLSSGQEAPPISDPGTDHSEMRGTLLIKRLCVYMMWSLCILTLINQETLSVTNISTPSSNVSLESHSHPAGQETPLLHGT